MPQPSFWTAPLGTYLAAILLAAFTAWLTAKLALRRDKTTWAKEAQQRTLQDCMERVGTIIAWAHGEVPYPFIPLMYLQVHLIALGANDLLPDLKAICAKAAPLHAAGVEHKLTEAELSPHSRDFIGDVIFLAANLQRHVARTVGLPVYSSITREEIDA